MEQCIANSFIKTDKLWACGVSVLYIYHLNQNICFCWREHIARQNTLPSIIQQKYTIKSSLKATPAATARELTWQLHYTDLVEQTIL